MSLIKIIANNIELDFVKETLSIKKENNALNRDFKVSYSSIPFLIIENVNTKKALGTRDLSSVKKSKAIEVVVFEGGKKYMGELQILSYLNGFRKCNLKYASSLLSIMNKKISEFMPIVSVIPGETNPAPFTETNGVMPSGLSAETDWKNYPVPFISQGFPDVKWQFPTMKWPEKFGKNLTVDDEWVAYQGMVNLFDEELATFIENSYADTNFEVLSVSNKNVVSPQIYLLSPLFYALESKGFVADGNFYNNDFIKKILMLSSKTNLTDTPLVKMLNTFTFSGAWNYHTNAQMYSKLEIVNIAVSGNYTLDYSFTFAGPASSTPIPLYKMTFRREGQIYGEVSWKINEITSTSYIISGTEELNLEAGTFEVYYFSKTQTMPVSFSVELKKKFKSNYKQMHPTIQLGRYLPEWTFATYLNALQNVFNLEINIDDLAKKMTIDFNEESISMGEKAVLKKSLELKSYEESPSNAFLLKYENSEDVSLWITKEGATAYQSQSSNFVDQLENKFKYIPNTYTAELSDSLDSKNGVGLMIYDPVTKPYTLENYQGQTLKIEGEKGIYEVYWRKFIKFLLNGSAVEMSGPFTETELNQILSLKRIFIDNQEYVIASTESRETTQNNYEVKFSLVSVTF